MTSYYWIKLYHEILDDPKMALLPDRLWRRIIELFIIAGKYGTTGMIPDTRSIAWMLRMDANDLEMDMKQIAATGIIEQVTNGWLVVNFEKRQEKVSGARRTAEFRKRQKKEQYYNESNTDNNDGVTTEKLNVTQINRIDTDKEEDIEQITAGVMAKDVTPFQELYEVFWDTTRLDRTLLDEHDCADTVRKWVKSKVTTEELRAAIADMRANNLAIARPSSVTNSIGMLRAKRKNGVTADLGGYTHA